MKKFAYLFAAASLALAFQACDNASSLSKDLEGAWTGNPDRLFDSQASSGTIIETFSFTPVDSVKDGGSVTVTSLLSVTGAVSGAEGITQPVSVTASGSASISGTYRCVSADRAEITLDPQTLTVNVDPDAVVVNADVLTGTSAPANMATLKPNLAQSIASQFRTAVSQRVPDSATLESLSIKDGTTLKFKIDKTTYTLTRQPSL